MRPEVGKESQLHIETASTPLVEADPALDAESPPTEADDTDRRRAKTPFSWAVFGPWAVPALLVILFITFCFASPHIFATTTNVQVIVDGQATIVLLAMALIIPLRAGDFDLSISAVMVLSGVIAGVLTAHGYSALIAFGAAILLGPLIGMINSLLVVAFGVDSLIATLGMLTVLTGIGRLISKENLVTSIPQGLIHLSSHRLFGFNTAVWAGWIVALGLWYVFELTPTGRFLLFIGGNRNSAKLVGLRVSRFRFGAYIVSGTLAALVGLLFAGSLGSVDPGAGGSYLLPPITAAFLGASAIKLGRFNVIGTLVAIYLLAVGISGLQLLGLAGWISDVFNGGCLIVAVSFSILFRRAATK
ncbi:ABC transporter permease [uncultured Jatrophihabitans sp.]|uniref:ABC transporter permease n=1 Tax=uncultured Jatrophihabitans sp. TaxID=1610747 RepID=UPI0035CB169D